MMNHLCHDAIDRQWITVVNILMMFGIFICGCTDKDKTPKSVEKLDMGSVYSPPQGYEASTVDPLSALYGGKLPQANQGTQITSQYLEKRFEAIKERPMSSVMPVSWRKAVSSLKSSTSVKVSAWSFTENTRMETRSKDMDLSLSLWLLGPRETVKASSLKALKSIPSLKGLPSSWGDQHEHHIHQGNMEAKIVVDSTSAELKSTHPTTLLSIEITWSRSHPLPKGELKNCRYIHALDQVKGERAPRWSIKHFKSTSSRRFVAWHEARSEEGWVWRATWLYRNGSYRDKAVGWWSEQLTRVKAVQIAERGLEQSWALKGGHEISWWPETEPEEMGCRVAGPLLSFEGQAKP